MSSIMLLFFFVLDSCAKYTTIKIKLYRTYICIMYPCVLNKKHPAYS